ncbi:hypothetical protein QR680_011156 [Steinernema hermaphroditum]|uniref:Uncharacterized protein n=1 Tax=Steinernema hermaphroditum TaxID=289476 RepID=A0AA39ISH6_9BILA|nr:hypothetical protein QR680_011156 [Steinernema hermaphroditum]
MSRLLYTFFLFVLSFAVASSSLSSNDLHPIEERCCFYTSAKKTRMSCDFPCDIKWPVYDTNNMPIVD